VGYRKHEGPAIAGRAFGHRQPARFDPDREERAGPGVDTVSALQALRSGVRSESGSVEQSLCRPQPSRKCSISLPARDHQPSPGEARFPKAEKLFSIEAGFSRGPAIRVRGSQVTRSARSNRWDWTFDTRPDCREARIRGWRCGFWRARFLSGLFGLRPTRAQPDPLRCRISTRRWLVRAHPRLRSNPHSRRPRIE